MTWRRGDPARRDRHAGSAQGSPPMVMFYNVTVRPYYTETARVLMRFQRFNLFEQAGHVHRFGIEVIAACGDRLFRRLHLSPCSDFRDQLLSADAGYCSSANLRTLSRRRIKGYIATGRQKHGSKSATAKRPAKPGSLLARMTSRLRRAGHRRRYSLRKQVVEPVFGQVKEARGFRQFLLRGIEKVKAEWAMICTGHNLANCFVRWPRNAVGSGIDGYAKWLAERAT